MAQRVFITLGRSGQVVERGGTGPNHGNMRGDSSPHPGSKRSMGDTVGNYAGSLFSSKRQRGDRIKWDPGHNGVDETWLTPNDLRLKLSRRRLLKQRSSGLEEQKKNLLRSVQPSASNIRLLPRPETGERFLLEKISCTHDASHAHQVDSMLKPNSSWMVNGLRVRSPDAEPRNYYSLEQYPSIRASGASTAKPFCGNGVHEAPRQTGFLPTAIKTSVDTTKHVTQLAPRSGLFEKNTQVGEEPLTVSGLLQSLGLGKYDITFRAEEVDMTALKQMGDKDLKDIGIPMGPRKKILLALLPRSKENPPQSHNVNSCLTEKHSMNLADF